LYSFCGQNSAFILRQFWEFFRKLLIREVMLQRLYKVIAIKRASKRDQAFISNLKVQQSSNVQPRNILDIDEKDYISC
jgi:hypothetical protein